MIAVTTTTLSSKGQVVIPAEIRERLGIKVGTRFVVIAERNAVILKVLDMPGLETFAPLMANARRVAKRSGLRRADVASAIARVRRER